MNKLETVGNGINLNLGQDAELQMMPLLFISPSFSIFSNIKMTIMPTLCISGGGRGYGPDPVNKER